MQKKSIVTVAGGITLLVIIALTFAVYRATILACKKKFDYRKKRVHVINVFFFFGGESSNTNGSSRIKNQDI